MSERHALIIGGGLAGLSSGCYARMSGYRATIVEHNIALGGVCTAWPRGEYLIDGCIHWLTGGPFSQAYEELGIVPSVELRTLEEWLTYRNVEDGLTIRITRDLDALARDLSAVSPEDADEIGRVMRGAEKFADLDPGFDRPQELLSLRDQIRALWNLRDAVSALVHFRNPMARWGAEHLKSEPLRRFFARLIPPEAPALFVLMVLGYLRRGWLSRPVGGTARFRDAVIARYQALGGEVRLHATVDEILVHDGVAKGVRLADGTMLEADVVISTASAPETTLRLLGGRWGADETRHRLEHWKLFQPIVLASFGVATPLEGTPSLMIIDGIEPIEIGGHRNEYLTVRVCNDDPCFAPPGHTVVQTMLATDYEWWATRASQYSNEKDRIAEIARAELTKYLPAMRDAVRVVDVATPLTYWNKARSWRGAYEGWLPSSDSFFGHAKKTFLGLGGFYMAGQWVEPGGGVPTALMSGRQVVQLVCAVDGRPFVSSTGSSAA